VELAKKEAALQMQEDEALAVMLSQADLDEEQHEKQRQQQQEQLRRSQKTERQDVRGNNRERRQVAKPQEQKSDDCVLL